MPQYTDPAGRGVNPIAVANAGLDVHTPATAAAGAMAPAIAAVTGSTGYCTGFEITGAGATAASVITVTLTGLNGGTMSFKIAIPAGAAVAVAPLIVKWDRPIPAASSGGAITLNVPSFGAGNTDAAAVLHGFRLPD